MSRSPIRVLLLVSVLVLILIPSAQAGVKFGGVIIGAGYSDYSGPYFYPGPFYGYGCYDPLWCGPYGYNWGPMFYTAPQIRPMGEISLRGIEKKAEIYIDGAYAGLAKDLGHIWLDPGTYDLEVRADGRPPVQRRVYVLTNKTLKLDFSRNAR